MRIIVIIGLSFICACTSSPSLYKYSGKTMGTSYHISTVGKAIDPAGIDSVLTVVNQSMSTYIPNSSISSINSSEDTVVVLGNDTHFMRVYAAANHVAEASGGAFDFTVMPIVNYYGFGYEKPYQTPLKDWESIVGYSKVQASLWDKKLIVKKQNSAVKMDFSAIAKGYGVDAVAQYLEANGIVNFLVEIGGEVRCSGKNDKSKIWRVGIDKPTSNGDQRFQEIISLDNASMATSGNYRNYKIIDGKKYVHTIDPRIGKPFKTDILSATVIHQDCMLADAYATTLMVLGMDEVKAFIEKENLKVFLIYDDQGVVKTYNNFLEL